MDTDMDHSTDLRVYSTQTMFSICDSLKRSPSSYHNIPDHDMPADVEEFVLDNRRTSISWVNSDLSQDFSSHYFRGFENSSAVPRDHSHVASDIMDVNLWFGSRKNMLIGKRLQNLFLCHLNIFFEILLSLK